MKYMSMLGKDFQTYANRKHDPNGETLLADEWRSREPKTEEEYLQFYKDCNFLDELVAWHTRSDKHPKSIQTRKILQVLSSLRKYGCQSLIDLGAGIGTDSLEIANLGYRVHAIEPNDKSVDFFNWRINKYGLTSKVTTQIGTEYNIPGHGGIGFSAHVIMFLEVIEHFHDPYKSLNFICDHRAPFLLFTQSFGVHEEERGGHPQHTDFPMKKVAEYITTKGYTKIKLGGLAFPPQLWTKLPDIHELNVKDVKPVNTFTTLLGKTNV